MPIRLAERATDTYQYPLLIRHLLHTPLATASSQEIVYRDRCRYTYATFARRIERLAAALARLGVEPGTTVAVMDWDSHRYLECLFAIPMMGAVLQTVNVRLSPHQIAYTMRHAGAEVALVNREFLPLLDALRDQLPALRAVVLIDDTASNEDVPRWISAEYERILAVTDTRYTFEDFDENAVATTFYTSGTTGDPKGVCFSHRQIVLHTLALLGACASPAHGQAFRHGDVYMPMTPMFHVHAWGNPYVATLLGVKQVYPGRYDPEDLVALRVRERVSFSHCVPTILQMVLNAAPRTGADLRGWKICIGGAALSAGLAREALRRGIDVYAGYGMSETGPVVAISRLLEPPAGIDGDAELEQRCRAGLPIPLVDLRLFEHDLNAVPHDGKAVGEIVVRAPWLTPCYVDDRKASEDLWRGGYLHTQDVARIDPSGFIQITDRIKDVIKSGGEWLSSLQLENLISQHPGIAEVAVIAAKDARWGERPHALIVVRQGRSTLRMAEEIRAHIEAAVAAGTAPRYAVPERITFVDALERTSVGKINKRRLRELFP
jgi:fatty-acyl-CoA synthase